jgi:dTDP-4-amino-4,6-dideoxygalactose transaminase
MLCAKPQESESTPQPAVRKDAAEAYPYEAVESEWAMPWVCRAILQRADLVQTLNSRRRNFEIFAQSIEPTPELIPVCRTLAADACPWGFPVIMRNRSERDYLLRAMGVPLFTFGEVLHPLVFAPGKVDRATLDMAQYLSDSLLLLAVHQKLGAADVSRLAQMVNAFAASL